MGAWAIYWCSIGSVQFRLASMVSEAWWWLRHDAYPIDVVNVVGKLGFAFDCRERLGFG